MVRTIFLYGLSMAAMVAALKFFEYRYFIRDLSLEFYMGVVAVLFTGLGIWTGLRLTRKRVVLPPLDFKADAGKMAALGISARELEVLQLIAQGLSNQEIADKLFVSLNTIKTHTANIFLKLEVNRRTQAIQRAKEWRLLP
jgi:NarL family two-component system response regulator LiaR